MDGKDVCRKQTHQPSWHGSTYQCASCGEACDSEDACLYSWRCRDCYLEITTGSVPFNKPRFVSGVEPVSKGEISPGQQNAIRVLEDG